MKNPMTIEHALALVTDYAATQYNPPTVGNSDELRQAADIIRNMAEEPVGESERTRPESHGEWFIGPTIKTWTETRVLKIVKQETDVKFEEAD